MEKVGVEEVRLVDVVVVKMERMDIYKYKIAKQLTFFANFVVIFTMK